MKQQVEAQRLEQEQINAECGNAQCLLFLGWKKAKVSL